MRRRTKKKIKRTGNEKEKSIKILTNKRGTCKIKERLWKNKKGKKVNNIGGEKPLLQFLYFLLFKNSIFRINFENMVK